MKAYLETHKSNLHQCQDFIKATRKRIERYKGSCVVIRSIPLAENVTTDTEEKHHATDPLRAL